jgi:hypothetical protein
MMQVNTLAAALLVMQVLSAETAPLKQDLEQSDQYPHSSHVFRDDAHVPFDQEMDFAESEGKISKEGSSATGYVKMGRIDISATVDHIDSNSQWQEEWRKNKSEDNSKSKSDKKEDSHAPSARVFVQWSDDW